MSKNVRNMCPTPTCPKYHLRLILIFIFISFRVPGVDPYQACKFQVHAFAAVKMRQVLIGAAR